LSKERRIALIDDDASFRTALYESLLSLGYSVNTFASGIDFASAGGERSYDCIITDVNMPGMSGTELMKILSARGSRVPVIMVTGRGEPALEAQTGPGGAICVLKKPFETEALLACLRRALSD
jgi:FixJ family two-component response regulator